MTTAPRTTYHRDATVTLWDVYQQAWRRLDDTTALHELGATLSRTERTRLARRIARRAR